MDTKQIIFIVLNIIGGLLVLGSYAYTFRAGPQGQRALWGGIPIGARGIYTVLMFLSAISFFIFTSFILFKVNPKEATVGSISAYILFLIFYILILLPSAAWTPLTLFFIQSQKPLIWILIRIVLFLVALGSLGVLISLLLLKPKQSGFFYWSSFVGITIFFLNTGIFDAIVWPYLFKV
jgi:hypothetical protein